MMLNPGQKNYNFFSLFPVRKVPLPDAPTRPARLPSWV